VIVLTDAPLAPADDVIAAVRIIRGILDHDPGPWDINASGVRGLALMVIAAQRANAVLLGHDSDGEQDAYVRGWLDDSHETATLLALKYETADG
jgi:hypothetical protein